MVPPLLRSSSLFARNCCISSACRTVHFTSPLVIENHVFRLSHVFNSDVNRAHSARTRCSTRPFAWLGSTSVTPADMPTLLAVVTQAVFLVAVDKNVSTTYVLQHLQEEFVTFPMEKC